MPNSARIDELQKKFNENPRRYFAPLADEYRKAGDLQAAIELCRSHLAQQPGHMSGHIVLGKALFESGELDEARGTFETALGLDPENLIALRHLGDIAQRQGDAYGARQWYQRVLDADPRNEEIAAQVRALDEMPATQAFGGAAAAERPTEPVLPPDLADAPDTLAESTVVDGTLPPALEPSAIAYLADEPTLEVPAYRTAVDAPIDLDMSGLDVADHGAAPGAPVAGVAGRDLPPAEPVRASNDLGLESMEFVAPSGADRVGAAEGLERPDYDFDPHVVDGAVRGEATPAAFVTETMAELYLQQGFHDEALQVYRQLLEANPADANLRARVEQLESGGRSSLAFGVSEEIVRAAQERHARAGRRTARHFFASLAARRAPMREDDGMGASTAWAAGAAGATYETGTYDTGAYDAGTYDAGAYDAGAAGASDVAEAPDTLAESTIDDGTLPPALEPSAIAYLADAAPDAGAGYAGEATDGTVAHDEFGAWSDPRPTDDPVADAGYYGTPVAGLAAQPPAAWGTAAEDATAASQTWDAIDQTSDVAPAEPGYDASGHDDGAGSAYDVSAFESDAWQQGGATSEPATPAVPATPPRGATPAGGSRGVGGTVDALFAGAGPTPDDEAAANALAGAFAGTPAAIPAVRPATGELSLDHVFRDTPRRSESQRQSSSFSFDQFFSDDEGGAASSAPQPAPPPHPSEGGDIEQFTAWLEGLKKK